MSKEIMASLMGKNKAQFMDDFFVGLNREKAEELINEIFALEQKYLKKHGGNMYEGVIDTLKMLKKNYKIMIVSNCQKGYLDAFITHYGNDGLFDDYECAGNTNLSKSENIRLVMNRNNIDKAIYVGDTKSDETAAREADIPFVFATYGFGEANSFDAKINSFREIYDIAENLL